MFTLVEKELETFDDVLIQDLESENRFLNSIITYVINSGGKRLRPALVYLFAKMLNNGQVNREHHLIAQIIELIHTATLIHDDIIDESKIRRGFTTVNEKWNSKTAVLTGDYFLARALNKLAILENSKILTLFSNTVINVCIGEIRQSLDTQNTSTDEYIEKLRRKTALLFAAGIESVALLNDKSSESIIKACRDYAINFGTAFQIIDDISDLTLTEKETGKPPLNDLRSGIITLPIIFAVNEYNKSNNNELINLINRKKLTDNDLRRIIELVFNTDAIEKARNLALEYANSAVNSLNVFEDNAYKKSLCDLALFTVKK